MSYLTQAELNQLRADIVPLLSGTAIIQRKALTSDGQGGYTTVWSNIGTASCRIEPFPRVTVTGAESSGERPISQKSWFVIVPAGTDIKPIDRVQSAGAQYEVVGVRSPRSHMVTVRTECELLEQGGAASAN